MRLLVLAVFLLIAAIHITSLPAITKYGLVHARAVLPLCASPRVEIEYCPGCKWMLRSSWYAQELLTTFESSIGEVALLPSKTQGNFIVRVDGRVIWDRREEATKGFPEAKELKQKVRDVISPEMNLGHSDSDSNKNKT